MNAQRLQNITIRQVNEESTANLILILVVLIVAVKSLKPLIKRN